MPELLPQIDPEEGKKKFADFASDFSDEVLSLFIQQTEATLGIEKIDDIAHAWGYERIADQDAFLFLKKMRTTLKKEISREDFENFLKFSEKFGKLSVSAFAMRMFSLIFEKKKEGDEINIKDFKQDIYL